MTKFTKKQSNSTKAVAVLTNEEKAIVMANVDAYLKGKDYDKVMIDFIRQYQIEFTDNYWDGLDIEVAKQNKHHIEKLIESYITWRWGIKENEGKITYNEDSYRSEDEAYNAIAESAELRTVLGYIKENGTDISWSNVRETLDKMEEEEGTFKELKKRLNYQMPFTDWHITFDDLGLSVMVQKILKAWLANK